MTTGQPAVVGTVDRRWDGPTPRGVRGADDPERDGASARVFEAVTRFAGWLERTGYESHDPYDVWGTAYGCRVRRMYYRRGNVALPLVAPLFALDVLAPRLPRLFLKKRRYATADAQLVLAFLNLHELTGDDSWRRKAEDLGEELLAYHIPGYSGPCWGYPFDWENRKGMWPKNTPFVTCTPYCFEAYLGLFDATGARRYLDIAASVAGFLRNDLHDVDDGDGAAAGSYSPIDHSMVINATAYRAAALWEAARRFGNPEDAAIARRHVRFILRHQRTDGSWFYAVGNNAEEFIDHFHTCFVLKSLWKLNRTMGSSEIDAAIRRGWRYYREHLFDAEDDPKYFSREPRFQCTRLEMYNFAEAITLGSLMADEAPGAREMARDLAGRLVDRYQLSAGYFVTRTFRGGWRHTMPFLRWPQAQLFYALTNLLVMERDKG